MLPALKYYSADDSAVNSFINSFLCLFKYNGPINAET